MWFQSTVNVKRVRPRTEARKAREVQLARGLESHTGEGGISPKAGVLNKGMRKPAWSSNRVTFAHPINKPRAARGKNLGEMAVAQAGKGVFGKCV